MRKRTSTISGIQTTIPGNYYVRSNQYYPTNINQTNYNQIFSRNNTMKYKRLPLRFVKRNRYTNNDLYVRPSNQIDSYNNYSQQNNEFYGSFYPLKTSKSLPMDFSTDHGRMINHPMSQSYHLHGNSTEPYVRREDYQIDSQSLDLPYNTSIRPFSLQTNPSNSKNKQIYENSFYQKKNSISRNDLEYIPHGNGHFSFGKQHVFHQNPLSCADIPLDTLNDIWHNPSELTSRLLSTISPFVQPPKILYQFSPFTVLIGLIYYSKSRSTKWLDFIICCHLAQKYHYEQYRHVFESDIEIELKISNKEIMAYESQIAYKIEWKFIITLDEVDKFYRNTVCKNK